MRRVVSIATALAFTLIAATAFANDTLPATSGEAISPVFLHARDGAPSLSDGVDEAAWSAGTALPTSRSRFDMGRKLSMGLQADDQGNVSSSPAMDDSGEHKNPGRALLLSAIMPGAGELYAGSDLKAITFFAVEMACWYGAVSYAQRGNDQTTSFEHFAERHWTESDYRTIEYEAATDESAGTAYTDPPEQWDQLSWGEKINYLPANFTHELPTTHNQQYYENVGKYLTQFGFGWDDQSEDDPNTKYLWDGMSRHAAVYVDMRYEANKMLDHSATFFSVILVNHVVSALDAGFTVRAHNRNIAQIEPQAGRVIHNDQPIAVAGLNVRF